MVELGQTDIGLLSPPVALSSAVLQEVVTLDSLVAVVPSDHALAGRSAIPLSALADEPLVSFSATRVPSFHNRIVAACLQQGFEPRVVQEATQIYTILSLVAGGLGIALLPSATASLQHPGVVYLPVSNPSALLRTQIDAVYLAGPMEAATQAFLGVVRQHAQPTRSTRKSRRA
jgi:DNA-binding transcriptional LysR family regulator